MTDDETEFELEVLRVGRALFAKNQPFQGAVIDEGAERDGIFFGEDLIVVVEATTSRRLDKAEKDGRKLLAICHSLSRQHKFKAVKGYFVTRDEPTADQRTFIERLNGPVLACSLTQLRSLLVDSSEYLRLRDNYPFGSARNPVTGDAADLEAYVPLGLIPQNGRDGTAPVSAPGIGEAVQNARTVILLGDFGAGKSMSLREVFRSLAAQHRRASKPDQKFPILLNLRDHQGQVDPDEAIRRHATKVGFDSPTKLVRAWRAGEVHVLLDGFDEMATTGWLGQASALRQMRRRSVELVRRFLEATPRRAGILVAGRRHFFDSQAEMSTALGLDHRPGTELILSTDQFSDEQMRQYLDAHGWVGHLPSWVPSRPLLLGYLAASNSLEPLIEGDGTSRVGANEGWDYLLDRICGREASMEVGVDGQTIRYILERLATIARSRPSGTGPLFQDDLKIAFTTVCGYEPDEGSYVLLQRMPGLGSQDLTDGSRHFIDTDLADAARSGDLVRYLVSSGGEDFIEGIRATTVPLGLLGIGVSTSRALAGGVTAGQSMALARRLQQRGAEDAYVFDVLRIAMEMADTVDAPVISISELYVDRLTFGDAAGDFGQVHFQDCLIDVLDLTEYDGDAALPTFNSCGFGTVLGAGSQGALPADHFSDCTFEFFDPSSRTTKGILATPGLSSRQRVALTVLKKVYLQAGAGRKESALVRGLDAKLRALVPDVVAGLVNDGLLAPGRIGRTVTYSSVRGLGSRVRDLLEKGSASTDVILERYR